eukprot:GHVU01011964.1.p1 GENE.GHVU01011964.1~~GHVU01011964.1.p1  ORF type:complete len:197 (+),score=28.15 GHVU01011964.1:47-592(+)
MEDVVLFPSLSSKEIEKINEIESNFSQDDKRLKMKLCINNSYDYAMRDKSAFLKEADRLSLELDMRDHDAQQVLFYNMIVSCYHRITKKILYKLQSGAPLSDDYINTLFVNGQASDDDTPKSLLPEQLTILESLIENTEAGVSQRRVRLVGGVAVAEGCLRVFTRQKEGSPLEFFFPRFLP